MQLADPKPIEPWLAYVRERGGTDLHVTPGAPPLARVYGDLEPIPGAAVLTGDAIEKLADGILKGTLREGLNIRKELDFSFDFGEEVRVRANAYRQRGSLAFAFRLIPAAIPGFAELGVPDVVEELVQKRQGLVLVTGPTGSGKSTTLASMVDRINSTRHCHVITIEDPIEYLHFHRLSAVSQREVGPDADSFYTALRSALREDPDVVLVGEMRDPESIAVALSIAETGHLVFATLHTNDSSQAIDRILDVFPAERRDLIQVQLAGTLEAVIYQRLLPRIDEGQVAAFEILLGSHAVRNLVREGKTRQIRNVLATSQSEGMQTIETSLARLVIDGAVDLDTALAFSMYPGDIRHAMTAANVAARDGAADQGGRRRRR